MTVDEWLNDDSWRVCPICKRPINNDIDKLTSVLSSSSGRAHELCFYDGSNSNYRGGIGADKYSRLLQLSPKDAKRFRPHTIDDFRKGGWSDESIDEYLVAGVDYIDD